MCNLCSLHQRPAGDPGIHRCDARRGGNLPPLPGLFPDMRAPGADGMREFAMLRWGMPTPPGLVKGIDRGVTNIRNIGSPH